MNYLRFASLISLALAVLATNVFGATGVKKMESVLDQLEAHLLDREGAHLSFGESVEKYRDKDENVTKYHFKKDTIATHQPGDIQLSELNEAIKQLADEVDALSSEVQVEKDRVLRNANLENAIDIGVKLAKSDNASIQSVAVKLDGFPIIRLEDTTGIWAPANKLALFSGPLQPGHHRVDLEAKMVLHHGGSLPANDDIYRLINQSFVIHVPDGKFQKKYTINITPPETLDDKPKAELMQ